MYGGIWNFIATVVVPVAFSLRARNFTVYEAPATSWAGAKVCSARQPTLSALPPGRCELLTSTASPTFQLLRPSAKRLLSTFSSGSTVDEGSSSPTSPTSAAAMSLVPSTVAAAASAWAVDVTFVSSAPPPQAASRQARVSAESRGAEAGAWSDFMERFPSRLTSRPSPPAGGAEVASAPGFGRPPHANTGNP